MKVEPLKVSTFQLPNREQVKINFVRLADGRLVARTDDELVARPTPPVAPK